MRKVKREELLDYQTYSEKRPEFLKEITAVKKLRRVHVGEYLTFLFENAQTVRYQVQEMMRVEKIVKEADILHELETYNAILGDDNELGCTLLIEIDDAAARPGMLKAWRSLPEHLYVLTEAGEKIRPSYDEGQMDDDRLSSVQFLKFALPEGAKLKGLGSDLEALNVAGEFSPEQLAALEADLAQV